MTGSSPARDADTKPRINKLLAWEVWDLPRSVRTSIALQTMRLMIPVIFAVAVAATILLLLAPSDTPLRAAPSAVGVAVIAAAWLLMRRGQAVPAVAITALLGALVTLLGMVLNGGVRAPIYFGSIAFVPFFATVFGLRATALFSGFLVTLGATFVVLGEAGLLPHAQQPTAATLFIVHTSWLALSMAFIALPIRFLRQAMKERDERLQEARDAREAKQRSDLLYRAMLDQSTHMMGLLDPRGRVVRANRVATEMVGVEISDVRGVMIIDTPWVSERYRDRVKAAIGKAAGGTADRFQFSLRDRHGGDRIIDAAVSPFRTDDGQVAHLIVEGRDITEVVRTQQQLTRTQRLESLGQLAGGVAHDFNNMLAIILNATELLAMRAGKSPDCADMQPDLDAIAKAARHGADLTGKLLAFSRKGVSKQVPFPLHASIDTVVGIVKHSLGRRVRVELDLCEGDPTVFGDPSAIEHAIVNLAVNARDAMPEGGVLTIGTRLDVKDDDWYVQVPEDVARGTLAEITVRDTGTGIPEEVKPHIFEPFFTTKPAGRGTGLGLAAVFGSVREMGGMVTVDSEPGEGTTFRIYLPASEEPTPIAKPRATDESVWRVIVVDDDEALLATTAELLRGAGWEVLTASNGVAALELVLANRSKLDAVVVDVQMPVMSGMEVARWLRSATPELAVVMMSGFSGDHEVTAALADAFIAKPFRSKDLRRTIEDARVAAKQRAAPPPAES